MILSIGYFFVFYGMIRCKITSMLLDIPLSADGVSTYCDFTKEKPKKSWIDEHDRGRLRALSPASTVFKVEHK